MVKKHRPYDRTYSESKNVFGSEPENILVHFCNHIKRDLPVLDMGAGQGRNSLFLAKKRFIVHALEPSKVASAFLRRQKKELALDMLVLERGFQELDAPPGGYSAVLVFGLIQILSKEDRTLLLKKLNQWICPAGLVFMTGFSCEDPSYTRFKDKWPETSKNLFSGPDGTVRFFLEPGEIPDLFHRYETLYHWEGMGPWHHHGDSKMERHSMVEAVFKKRI